jgi:transposase
MVNLRTLVGLDVHAAKIVAAILDTETGELGFRKLGGEVDEAVNLCRRLEGPVRVTYEAGPTGYGLARGLDQAGIDCLVAAPGKIPRGATDKIKNDRRDAEHLVRLLGAGKLSAVRVPTVQEEGLRDLVRAREDVRVDLMRARHRLSKLLLRHGIRFEKRAWTALHKEWLDQQVLGDQASQATLLDYRQAIELLVHRRGGLEYEISRTYQAMPLEGLVERLRCFRGIDTLSAVGLVCEIGDLGRFKRAGQLMSFVGLTPSERSSGEHRRLGSITCSGSSHARRLWVEAAWHYRRPPRVGKALERRQQGKPTEAIKISWDCQRRLHRTWWRLERRGKRRTVVAVAVARELAGFCWAVATLD